MRPVASLGHAMCVVRPAYCNLPFVSPGAGSPTTSSATPKPSTSPATFACHTVTSPAGHSRLAALAARTAHWMVLKQAEDVTSLSQKKYCCFGLKKIPKFKMLISLADVLWTTTVRLNIRAFSFCHQLYLSNTSLFAVFEDFPINGPKLNL